jgi:hypothetical protein
VLDGEKGLGGVSKSCVCRRGWMELIPVRTTEVSGYT